MDPVFEPSHQICEATVAATMCKRLDPYFVIRREVEGRHWSGKRLRIDAVITPRDAYLWKWQGVSFGLEFKPPRLSTADLTSWIAQCCDYAQTEWDGYGYLYIFANRLSRHIPDNMQRLILRLLGRFFVGELTQRKHSGLSLVHAQDHVVWCDQDGVRLGKTATFRPTWGRR